MTDDAFLEFVRKKRDEAAKKEKELCNEPGCLVNNEGYAIANVTMNLLNEVINEYERHHTSECPFCKGGIDARGTDKIVKGDQWFVMNDAYPVSRGHALLIPYRHIESIWDLTPGEFEEFPQMLKRIIHYIDMHYRPHPDGYNIGMNIGEAAGQTVPHLHVHVIPRYKGDMINPRGGIRGCIPDKRKYDDPRALALHGGS